MPGHRGPLTGVGESPAHSAGLRHPQHLFSWQKDFLQVALSTLFCSVLIIKSLRETLGNTHYLRW